MANIGDGYNGASSRFEAGGNYRSQTEQIPQLFGLVISNVLKSDGDVLGGFHANVLRLEDLRNLGIGQSDHHEIAGIVSGIRIEPIAAEIVKLRSRLVAVPYEGRMISAFIVDGVLDSSARGILRALRYDVISGLAGHKAAEPSFSDRWKPGVEIGIVPNYGQERVATIRSVCGQYDYLKTQIVLSGPVMAPEGTPLI